VRRRRFSFADNRLPERAVWDFDALREQFRNLIEIDFEIDLTGFTTGEVDLVLDGQPGKRDPADEISGFLRDGPVVSKVGDEWELGRHRLICGSALRGDDYHRLLGAKLAQMVITEPWFKIAPQRSGMARDRGQSREVDARGESLSSNYATLVAEFMRLVVGHSQNGSIHFLFLDWPRIADLLAAARPIYAEWKDLLVWNKGKAGHGSFYRPQHQLIAVFKSGTAAHIANTGVAGQGRVRSNVLDYAAIHSLHPVPAGGRGEPTEKPLALVADLICDCSRRNGLILDPFGRSGTTILAAEKTGRIARVIESDPRYVDMAIRRWERMTGVRTHHAETKLSFADTEAGLLSKRPARPAALMQRPLRRLP
jgi:hypothetical protein